MLPITGSKKRPTLTPLRAAIGGIVMVAIYAALLLPTIAMAAPFELKAVLRPFISDAAMGIIMLVLFLFFLMLGFPIAFTLMALGVAFGYYALGDTVFPLFVQRTYSVMANDVLISIPLFLFMGYVIERANILDRLFRSIQLAAGWLPGSLAVATLLTCALFATATGIVGAVVTLMGLLAFPAMLRAGYDTKLAAGVVCAGGCLGILIPPSVMLILYGATAGVSVVKLYAAAFVPGLMLAGMYVAYAVTVSALYPQMAPKLPAAERDVPMGKVVFELATSFLPLATLILGVLGVIMAGLATPQEAAAVGALGSLVLALVYNADYGRGLARAGLTVFLIALAAIVLYFTAIRVLGVPFTPLSITAFLGLTTLAMVALIPGNVFGALKLEESAFLTARASAMVCWLFVGSAVFSSVFALLGGQKVVEDFILGLNLSPFWFLILTQGIIFVLGWPLEWTEIIVIFLPIFLPLLDDFCIDPLFFGVLVALNLQTSFLSPPVAMAPFYLKGVAPKHVTIDQIFSGVMPFLYIVVLSMVLFYAFPKIGLGLPEYLYGHKSPRCERKTTETPPAMTTGAAQVTTATGQTATCVWTGKPA
jgi:TRAP-type mannitol/chloroaromatic compound transport system permease large subunit